MTLCSPATVPAYSERSISPVVDAHLDFLSWVGHLLNPKRQIRKLRGGKWELWWHGYPANCFVWDRVDQWTVNGGSRPPGLSQMLAMMEFNGKIIDVPACAKEGCDNLVMLIPVDKDIYEERLIKATGQRKRRIVRTETVGWEPNVACERHTPGYS